MALNSYLTLKGKKQGDIKGGVTQKGREGQIMVIAVSHEVVSPRDAAAGAPPEKRQHKPLVITKEVDKASPLLYKALVNNETITSFILNFYQPAATAKVGGGAEVNHFRIELSNAKIASVQFRMLNNKTPELTRYAEYEEVAFNYEKITWTWVEGGIIASDDWEVQ